MVYATKHAEHNPRGIGIVQTISTASGFCCRSDEEWHGPGPKPLVRPGATELQKHARLNNMLTSRIPDVLTHMNLRLAQER